MTVVACSGEIEIIINTLMIFIGIGFVVFMTIDAFKYLEISLVSMTFAA
jgi:hypothetical protein